VIERIRYYHFFLQNITFHWIYTFVYQFYFFSQFSEIWICLKLGAYIIYYISNAKQSVFPRKLKWMAIFKRTNDHIFEKNMNRSCLPHPRPTPLSQLIYTAYLLHWQTTITMFLVISLLFKSNDIFTETFFLNMCTSY
jgi:hypothetical protein